ncbi:hypothetical protein [Ectobacillus ponti]|uniref:Uncharacterized protein n=1 Tax=Ectobacillus ponti TaxID=2961894 RepID=A0AA41X4A3_9BACI|nr:hypothetical protein [Ectobacillus ponti]MCP8968684.1 hypothetical protein [Ectobacillus ponti]
MLIPILFLVVSVLAISVCVYYMRVDKQDEVLLLQKGSLLARGSRFVVCSKCGRAQASSGGYQECCRTRM